MKYLNKTSVDNYYNILFSPDKNDVNIILLNETNKINYDDYDVYIKFVNTSKIAFICLQNMINTDGTYNYKIAIDGIVYTFKDICNLYETLNLDLTDQELQNYKQNYLSGRICFPFETLNEEHVLSYKFINTSESFVRSVSMIGGWASGVKYKEICVLRNILSIGNVSSTNVYTGGLTYYFNNLQEDINTKESLNAVFDSMSINDAINYIYLPKNVKRLPSNAGMKISLNQINFDDLTELEEIGVFNYFKDSSDTPKVLDFSKYTKLTKIDEDSFININNVTKVILPPNIETIGDMAFRYITWNNAIIEVPESIVSMNNSFYYPEGDGFYTIKFKSATPPTDKGRGTSPLGSFYSTVLQGKCYLMVPRGSKKDYLIAMTGLDSSYPTPDAMYGYYETYQPDKLEHIIEYDPE